MVSCTNTHRWYSEFRNEVFQGCSFEFIFHRELKTKPSKILRKSHHEHRWNWCIYRPELEHHLLWVVVPSTMAHYCVQLPLWYVAKSVNPSSKPLIIVSKAVYYVWHENQLSYLGFSRRCHEEIHWIRWAVDHERWSTFDMKIFNRVIAFLKNYASRFPKVHAFQVRIGHIKE